MSANNQTALQLEYAKLQLASEAMFNVEHNDRSSANRFDEIGAANEAARRLAA